MGIPYFFARDTESLADERYLASVNQLESLM
jgi:hypothetical protein